MKQQLSIDKQNWIPVKFGDVVFEPKESIKDPVIEGIQHVVGLEHIESNDVHLRKFSSLESTTTFSKKFAVGDVLFGRRRAYLKKAALASFNGICSGDITVFRANNDLLLPELLPFVVHNEKFFDYAVKHSAGGLSPRVKFKDLANYEFLLPPKDQQAELAELLWAMDESIQSEILVQENVQLVKNCYTKKVFKRKLKSKLVSSKESSLKKYRLEDLAVITGGSTPSRRKPELWNGNIPWLTPSDVTNHSEIEIQNSSEYITSEGLKSISNRLYPPGTILYCSRATIGYAVINSTEMSTNQGFTNFVVNERVNNYFLYFLLQYMTPDLLRLAGGSTFLEISKSAIRQFEVMVPDKKSQLEIVNNLKSFENTLLLIKKRIIDYKQLQRSLINEIF